MRGMIQYFAIFALVFSFCMAGGSQTATLPECPECEILGYGPNVLLTSALTAGQTIRRMFRDGDKAVLVSDTVKMWCTNTQFIPCGVPEEKRQAAKEAVVALNTLLNAAPQAIKDWKMRTLYLKSWADLPGKEEDKAPIKEQFEKLRKQGMMTLTFLDRTPIPPTELSAFKAFVQHPTFKHLCFVDLFTIESDPLEFDDPEIDILSAGLGADVLWNDVCPPDMICQNRVDGTESTKLSNTCCDKVVGSPTYRKCRPANGLNCGLCPTYCCLWSNNCP